METLQEIGKAANVISVFCRVNTNTKQDLPIRFSEMGMLIFTVQSEEPVTPMRIANLMKVKKPMVTDMVATLYRKGYLLKVPSQEDRRSYTLQPTQKAIQLVEEAYESYMKRLHVLIKEMGESDFMKMIALLEKANGILLKERDK